ncbi:MAG: hypothetical protein JSW68_08475 [Burkholderiales bacterium]|nr:MAG: hypothetical protein JSW68_08475 [Burkholderiales bacterium]
MSVTRTIHGVDFYFDFSDWGEHALDGIAAAERAAALVAAEPPELVREAHALLERADTDDEFNDLLYEEPDNPEFAAYWRLQRLVEQARDEKLRVDSERIERGYHAYICLP